LAGPISEEIDALGFTLEELPEVLELGLAVF